MHAPMSTLCCSVLAISGVHRCVCTIHNCLHASQVNVSCVKLHVTSSVWILGSLVHYKASCESNGDRCSIFFSCILVFLYILSSFGDQHLQNSSLSSLALPQRMLTVM